MTGYEIIDITNWHHQRMKALRHLHRHQANRLRRERMICVAKEAAVALAIFGVGYVLAWIIT